MQGEPLPKRDIVDTTFHTSCMGGLWALSHTVLPTVRERNRAGAWGTWDTVEHYNWVDIMGSTGHWLDAPACTPPLAAITV